MNYLKKNLTLNEKQFRIKLVLSLVVKNSLGVNSVLFCGVIFISSEVAQPGK